MTILQIEITRDVISAIDNQYGLYALIVLVIGTLLMSGIRLWFEYRRKNEYNKVLEKSEEKLILLTGAVEDVGRTMQKMLGGVNVLLARYTNEVSLDCALNIVENQLEATANKTWIFVNRVLEENHIKGNEELVRNKLENEVLIYHLHDKEYLNQFKLNGRPIGSYVIRDWVTKITEMIVSGVLCEDLSKRQLSDRVYQKFESFALETKDLIRGKDGKDK